MAFSSFSHFSVRTLQLQAVDFCLQHTIGTERLVTGDCSVSALTYK